MNYPAVEVKALYDSTDENIEVSMMFVDIHLQGIPNEYLDTTGQYLKPRERVVSRIKAHYEEIIDRKQVEQEARKLSEDEFGGVDEFEVQVGVTYLDDTGSIDHFGHFDSYNALGPSPRRIRELFA